MPRPTSRDRWSMCGATRCPCGRSPVRCGPSPVGRRGRRRLWPRCGNDRSARIACAGSTVSEFPGHRRRAEWMSLAPIPLSALTRIGVGLKRPEDVVVGRDGRVWASDQLSACAEVRPDGTLRRVGRAGGAPNGINMDTRESIVIANYGLGDGVPGPLQRLDVDTGAVETLCGAMNGRTLVASNYPIVDRAGNVWCTHSTWDTAAAERGSRDGFVYRVTPSGR